MLHIAPPHFLLLQTVTVKWIRRQSLYFTPRFYQVSPFCDQSPLLVQMCFSIGEQDDLWDSKGYPTLLKDFSPLTYFYMSYIMHNTPIYWTLLLTEDLCPGDESSESKGHLWKGEGQLLNWKQLIPCGPVFCKDLPSLHPHPCCGGNFDSSSPCHEKRQDHRIFHTTDCERPSKCPMSTTVVSKDRRSL